MIKNFNEVVNKRFNEISLDSLIKKYEQALDENLLLMNGNPNSVCHVSVDPVDYVTMSKATISFLKELKMIKDLENVSIRTEEITEADSEYKGKNLFLHPKFMRLSNAVIAKKMTLEAAALELGVSIATFSRRLQEYREILKGRKQNEFK